MADTNEPLFPRVVRDPNVLGGEPIVEGTRWPTYIAVHYGFNTVRIREEYPHLRIDQVMSAVLYEQLPHRRIGRVVGPVLWRIRYAIAARALGVSASKLEDML